MSLKAKKRNINTGLTARTSVLYFPGQMPAFAEENDFLPVMSPRRFAYLGQAKLLAPAFDKLEIRQKHL